MTQAPKRFAELLQAGINTIADRTSKRKGVVRDELGYAIGRKGGSAIEYWGYGDGHIPKQQAEVAALARLLVDRAKLDRRWLTDFLESANYPDSIGLITELFPGSREQPSHNLPLAATPFVGRAKELMDLARLIANPDCRLITLVGPGGSGKTRLALEAARHAHPTFADGITFVALAPLESADRIVSTVANTLNFTLDQNAESLPQLLRYLRGQTMLLMLDNMEHLLPSRSPTVDDEPQSAITLIHGILAEAADVTLLATSRERLNLHGEWVYDVGGLETPTEEETGAVDYTPEAYSALTLFLQTARRVHNGFIPDTEEQAAIVDICRLVEGTPLALELAATWVRVLSCREVAAEIEASLNFLSTTLHDLRPRHRSMQAVFDHSWQLLTTEEQQVLARCSVFRGGFTREAAEQVANATLPIMPVRLDG